MEINSQKFALRLQLKKKTLSKIFKKPPKRRKFAQSGHPGSAWHFNLRRFNQRWLPTKSAQYSTALFFRKNEVTFHLKT
jgi:hypothetical protein